MKAKTIGVIALLAGAVAMTFVLLRSGNDRVEQQSLLLGTNVWTGYEPLYLARSLGYFDEGSVRLVEFSSASQVITAFRNRTIDVAALTLDEVLLLKERGHDLRVILITDISDGGDAILGKPNLTQLTDLQGCNVGVENTALGAYVLTRALQTANVPIEDVNVVPLEVDEQERAFMNGQVDAVVTFEPVRTRLLAAGAVQLFDSTQMPGEIVDVLAIRADALPSDREQVGVLLTGWFKALDYLHDNPKDAAQRMSGRLNLSPDDVLASFDGLRLPDLKENIALLEGEPPRLVKVAENLATVMRREKLLQDDVVVSQLFFAVPVASLQE